MLALLFAKLHKAEVYDRASVLFMAAFELMVFDVPVIMILYVMWRSI